MKPIALLCFLVIGVTAEEFTKSDFNTHFRVSLSALFLHFVMVKLAHILPKSMHTKSDQSKTNK